MKLFDANAIINLIKKDRAEVFLDGATLDLAFYETLNAIWKAATLFKKLDEKTASCNCFKIDRFK